MIKNKDLHFSIKKAIKSAFQFYSENLVIDSKYSKDPMYLFFAFNKLESQIALLPDFIEAVSIMKKDENLSRLEYKLVGTLSSTRNIEGLHNCLFHFINNTYLKSSEFKDELIDEQYLDFENFFYASELRISSSSNLYNFDFSDSQIDFGNGLLIKRIDELDSNSQKYDMYKENFSTEQSKSSFNIILNYKARKVVSGDISTEDYLALGEKELPKSAEIFDSVITSLRLLKSSGAYRGHKIETKQIDYTPAGGTLTTIPVFENTVLGAKCTLNSNEVEELLKLFHFIIKEKDSRFGVAVRRLTSGAERRNNEDRLIDYMIGLETLFLPDGSTELSFRLSLRVGFLLNKESGERKLMYKFLRDMYGVRSQIVHGNKYNLTGEDVLKIEEILRQSVKLWVADKTLFIDKLSNNEDGKLNTIFFET